MGVLLTDQKLNDNFDSVAKSLATELTPDAIRNKEVIVDGCLLRG